VGIRALTSVNADLLESVAPGVFDNEIRPEYAQAFLDDPRHAMFVAVDDGTVIGMASSFEYFHPDKPQQLFINEVGVAPTHRRRGIGRKLVEALISYAERRGCTYAWLGTDSDNRAGQACFSSVPDVEAPQTFLLYEWDLQD